MSKANKIAIVAILLMVVTNPLVAVYVNEAIDWFFTNIVIRNSGFVSGAGLVYLVTLYVLNYRKANKMYVPSKTSKVKQPRSGMKYELQA